ncbi:MAG: Holliday junction resolvase RuvX [Candidatus Moranbacteria bacterium]|nr:Holliday junction resolvase RuvX [Candidatus Moranbacteria bacterium]
MDKSIGSSNMAQVSTFLGVDFGTAKIGLALADEETRMAFAYDTLKNDKEFLSKLREIIEQEHVKTIVMGVTRFGGDSKNADEKIEFGEKIERELGIAVMFQDEMFTTKMAQENIKMRGGRNIAESDDKEAARIILQSWLDRNVTAQRVKAITHES